MSEPLESQASQGSNPYPVPLVQTWFEEFDLPAEVLAGLKDAGYTYCTPLQAQVIPPALAGRDVAAQARTQAGHAVACCFRKAR